MKVNSRAIIIMARKANSNRLVFFNFYIFELSDIPISPELHQASFQLICLKYIFRVVEITAYYEMWSWLQFLGDRHSQAGFEPVTASIELDDFNRSATM